VVCLGKDLRNPIGPRESLQFIKILKNTCALEEYKLNKVDTIVWTAGAWAGGSVRTPEGLAAIDRSTISYYQTIFA